MDALMEQPPWLLVGVAVVAIVIIQSMFPPKHQEATVPQNPYPKSARSLSASATSASTKKKKKKTKKKSAAVAPAAKEDEEPPMVEEPAVVSEPPAAPAASTTSKKKKKKKSKKAAVVPTPAPPVVKKEEPTPPPKVEETPTFEEEEDDEEDDVARLLNASQLSKTGASAAATGAGAKKKKKKKKKKKTGTDDSQQLQPSESRDDEHWVMVHKSNSKEESTPTPVAASAGTDAVHTVTLAMEASDKATLVGPKGATIQEITTTSGARLDIDLPVLKITGTEAAISVAMEMVQTLLSAHKAKSAFTVTLSGKDINMSDGVKAIIGKGGSTIQQIQSSTGCKLDASIDGAKVVITGPSQELVDKAATLCRHAVFGEHQATLDLQDKSRVMLVLGKGFQKIRQFQDESGGAKLDIAKNSTILKISGPTAAVNKAKNLVTQWLNLCAGITLSIPQSAPGSFDKVGAIYGKGGATIRSIQDKTGAFIHVDDKAGKVQISGVPAAVQGALKMVQQAMEDGCLLEEGDVRDTITIPKKAGPTVIGRGGSNIKQLESDHKVKVRISGPTCIVIGNPDAVTRCNAALSKTFEPFLKEERIQQEADRLASEQETTSGAGGSAWNASIDDDDADGW